MQNKALHIISFDNPFPPNYGGIIDVYFKIKALQELGFKIHLHCFVSKIPTSSEELQAVCEAIFFYKIAVNPILLLSKIPFSVLSRNNKELLKNISKTQAPVLFESLKTTFLVHSDQLKNHYKILRLHNIEQDYFNGISKSETSFLRKILFFLESKKYQHYEKVIRKFNQVITLSHFENDYISQKFNNSVFIPVFHGNQNVLPLKGMGSFALYHGDLNTSDNKETVRFLVAVFKEIPDYKLVIASGSNGKFVRNLIQNHSNIEFVTLLNFGHLQQLLQEAHMAISWSFQKSGTKLKLINALFNGRFSIINEYIVDDSIVSDLCIQVATKDQLIDTINELKNRPFTDFLKRKAVLEVYLNDQKNAELIDKLIP